MDKRVVMIFDLRLGAWFRTARRSWYSRMTLTGLTYTLFMSWFNPCWLRFEKSCYCQLSSAVVSNVVNRIFHTKVTQVPELQPTHQTKLFSGFLEV